MSDAKLYELLPGGGYSTDIDPPQSVSDDEQALIDEAQMKWIDGPENQEEFWLWLIRRARAASPPVAPKEKS